MRMRLKLKKSTTQLIAIVMMSLLAGLAVFTYTTGVEARVKSNQETTEIFLVTSQISLGTPLNTAYSQGYIQKSNIPKNLVPAGALTKIDTNNSELLAIQTLQPGQILLESNFGLSAANTGSLVIPDGELAVTVSLSDPARVANFLQPGSEITIFVTGQNGKQKFTGVLIPKAKVLAVGNQVLPSQGGAAGTNTSALITVAVNPSQAKKLIHASQTLALYFGLRTTGVDFGDSLTINDETILN